MERMRLLGEVAMLESDGYSRRLACRVLGISESSVMRWRQRVRQVLGSGCLNALMGRGEAG
jgi:transposase-like protein